MSSFRITCFLLIATSLFCFSFIDTHSEQSISEDDYMFQQGNVFEYDVVYTYPDDSIVTMKRYYKITEVNISNGVTRASVVYYSGSLIKQQKVLSNFEIIRKSKSTIIDALHLAAVYSDDSVRFGKDKLLLNYPDSMDAAMSFSNINQTTPTQYFVYKNRGGTNPFVTGAPKYTVRSEWSVMGVQDRTVYGPETIIVPFDTLLTTSMYFDVVRENVSRAAPGGIENGPVETNVVQRINIQEWYNPKYGVVKRRIEDTDINMIVTMSLSTIYVP